MITITSFVCLFKGALKRGNKTTKKDMKYFDKDAFIADVTGICCKQGLNETDDADILVTCWSSLFSSTIDKHAHIKSTFVSERYC